MAVPWGGEERARAVMSLHAVNFCYLSDLISTAAPIIVQLMQRDEHSEHEGPTRHPHLHDKHQHLMSLTTLCGNTALTAVKDRRRLNTSRQDVQFQLLCFFKFPSLV